MALFVSATFAGCTMPANDGSGSASTGHVAFFVKDAPSDDFSSVFVTFSRVEVHRAGGENDTEGSNETASNTTSPAPSNSTSAAPSGNATATNSTSPSATKASDSGWIVIVNSTQTVDLKAFQGDARAFLGGSDIAVGKYTQIRIFVDRAYGVANGTQTNLSVPSGTLKIVRPWTVESGKETRLIVDFELDKSIHQTGNGKYQLKPVLKLDIEHVAPMKDGSEGTPANGNETRASNTHKPTDKGKP